MKKSVKILLTIIILSILMTVTVSATETKKEESDIELEQFVSENIVYVNPLYRDIISEEDLNEPSDIMLFSMPDQCRTIESAGESIREGLKERNETIEVIYITNESIDGTILNKCIDEAMKHTGVPTEGDYISWQYSGWNAMVQSILDENNRVMTDGNGNYYYKLTYTLTYYSNYEQEMEVDRAVSNLLNKLNIIGSDYQKITKIYDYICTNVRYDYDQSESNLKHTAYAALINKKAVCQGYAVLLYRLLLENNIDTRLIAGVGNGGPHGWNIVKIGNYYYNLDSTWDAGRTNVGYNYYLLADKNFRAHTRYNQYLTKEFYQKYPMANEDYKGEITNINDTGKIMLVNNVWCFVKNGVVDYNYTGIGTNEFGTWYIKNGIINFNFSGTFKDKDGKTYVIEKSRVMTSLNTVMQVDGIWRLVANGIVDYNYTGIGTNEFGTWYIKNGAVDFTFKGTMYKEKIAYIIENGKVILTTSEDKTGIMLVNGIWRMVLEGLVKYQYNGIGTNENGTWYVKNGVINFDYTGTFKHTDGKTYIIEKNRVMTSLNTVRQIDVAWRMIKNGVIEYNYTGIGTNEFGTWYIENGVVNFNYKDTYYEEDKAHVIEGGKVLATIPKTTTKVMEINQKWRMVINGKVQYDYTGIGKNEFGTWYIENGTINFNYTGTFKDKDEKTYVIEKNRVMTSLNTVKQVDGIWRLVKNGIIEYNYTGIGTNEFGTWYIENGTVNFNYKDTYYEEDKAYIIEGGKVLMVVPKNKNEVMQINGSWRMVIDGKVQYDYTGIGSNSAGTWYLTKGIVDFKYVGNYIDTNGKVYKVINSRIVN